MTAAPESIVAAAVDLAARGWSVIPLKGDKRPAASTWKAAQLKAAMPTTARTKAGKPRQA